MLFIDQLRAMAEGSVEQPSDVRDGPDVVVHTRCHRRGPRVGVLQALVRASEVVERAACDDSSWGALGSSLSPVAMSTISLARWLGSRGRLGLGIEPSIPRPAQP